MLRANRRSNFDLIRAVAISGVVIYHVAQMSPLPPPHLMSVTRFGEYGVDHLLCAESER
jgi:peptidoglycan/LPS O-acetylase OafA/YrhL